jgi:hypothetical protein
LDSDETAEAGEILAVYGATLKIVEGIGSRAIKAWSRGLILFPSTEVEEAPLRDVVDGVTIGGVDE